MLKERYYLASERIREIPEEKGMTAPAFEGFFGALARLILAALCLADAGEGVAMKAPGEDILGEIGPGRYRESYACPSFACQHLGEDLGRPLSVLYYEICSMILPALLGSREEMLIRMELFLEVYQAFVIEFREKGGAPEGKYITGKIREYLSDYFREETLRRAKELTSPAPLPDFSFLCGLCRERGEEEEKRAAASLSEGFEMTLKEKGFDQKALPLCGLGVFPGPLKLWKAAAAALEERGIRALPYLGRRSLFDLREEICPPDFAFADPGFYKDHKEDLGLFLDESLRTKILQALETALHEEGGRLSSFAGWAFFEGERNDREAGESSLLPDPMAVRLGRHQRKLLRALMEKEDEMLREAGLFLTDRDVFRLPL